MPHTNKYNAPKIKEHKGIQLLTTIWLVPFIAMIIALWLAYQYYSKIGPTIQITFKSNAGLIANQSQLKFRDVTVGMVSQISISKDGEGVTVKVKVNKEMSPYLNEKTKLWIVHADVGSHGVSGLDTLLSGSYIELHGLKEKKTKTYFKGLEKPFIDRDAQGSYYLLSAPNSNNISEGSNVYYRMIKVGRVERVAITPDGKKVNFTIFVEDEYTPFINDNSQFYTSSSLSLDFSQGKLDMTLASASQLVHGGISIYTPLQNLTSTQEESKKEKRVFPLYKSLSQMKAKHLMTGSGDKVYAFNFKNSITKLEIGSPLEFNGFQVGFVTDIESHFEKKSQDIQSKVFAIIHTKAFENNLKDENNKTVSGKVILEELVVNGLRASLDSSIPMIGSDYINLIFEKNSIKSIVKTSSYDLFPTINETEESSILSDVQKLVVKLEKLPLENLLLSAEKLVNKFEKLPLEKVVASADNLLKDNNKPVQNVLKDLRRTINNFDVTVSNLNSFTEQESLHALPMELTQTMQELTRTLEKVQVLSEGYGADSKFASELSLTLKELTLTAESMGRVSLKLEKKPNALILGDD